MKPTLLASLFPNASHDCQKANPQLKHCNCADFVRGIDGNPMCPKHNKKAVWTNVGRKRGIPNKTEAEFALRLEAMKRNGEILRYEYEGMTLRWAGMSYTPDFVVFPDYQIVLGGNGELQVKAISIRLIEVKGGHIWDRDIVRFKGARAHWPEFRFEMWQKKAGIWKKIH